MKKVLLAIVAILILLLVVGYFIANEKLPEGDRYEEADALAKKMLLAVNDSAWQETGAVSWTFMGSHDHLWDRHRHLARVQWKSYEALVDLNKIDGVVYKDGEALEGKKADKMIRRAWKYWVNDSFWLNPVSKAFDDGVQRSLVDFKDGRTGLRVSYSSGGNTPGDTYVWFLDENALPTSWKMWVSIIPIGGLEVPWNSWITTETGVVICNIHDAAVDLELGEVKTAFTLEELTGGDDPFSALF